MNSNQIGIQGETLPLIFNYTLDGTPLGEVTNLGNIECQLCEEGSSGALKLTKLNSRISLNQTTGYYEALLTQQETFNLPRTVKWQIKILDSANNAVADDIGVFTLGSALSKTPLGGQ